MSIHIRLSLHLSRLRPVLLLLCLYLFSACSGGALTASPPATGPIQFYDVHGTLLCQLHGQNPHLNCLADNNTVHQTAPHFIAYVLNELANDLHVSITHLPATALNVATTLDLNLQKQVLQKTEQYITKAKLTFNMTNAAVVILDYHNGAIRTLIGSLDNNVNIVTQNQRQVGSLMKPLVYATAFEQGISPGEVIYDGPFSVGTLPYSPVNYDGKFHGYMSYRTALQNDYNIPALKTYLKTGFVPLRKNVLAMGLTPADIGTEPIYSLPFGPKEMPLLDMTVAYGTIANGGVHVPPHTIEKISTSDGQVVYTQQVQRTQAISQQTAFMMTDVMSDNKARLPEFPPCSALVLYTTTQALCQAGNPGTIRPAAAHIGVTDTFRDTLTVGYTTDLVAGSWTGNSDASVMANITGLDGAAQIWHDSMLLAEAGRPVQQFPGPPSNLMKKTVAYPHLTTTDWYHSVSSNGS